MLHVLLLRGFKFAGAKDCGLDLTRMEICTTHYLELVLLRDFEALTIGEIAQRLGKHPGAVKSRLHLAQEREREYMLAEGLV